MAANTFECGHVSQPHDPPFADLCAKCTRERTQFLDMLVYDGVELTVPTTEDEHGS